MRVLIIEDEKKNAAYLKKGLQQHGFVCDLAACARDGLHAALSSTCDLIILNMALPDRDGWSLLGELRKKAIIIPVICLSDRDSLQERVRGLDLGADDYLLKPFAFSELLARAKVVLRRGAPKRTDVIRIGDLELDFEHYRVRRKDRCIDLTAKEFLLLGLLARNRGKVLSRTVIAEQIWDMNFECNSNVIDVVIRRLRKKVDGPSNPPIIHTVRGMGYVLDDAADRS